MTVRSVVLRVGPEAATSQRLVDKMSENSDVSNFFKCSVI